MIIHGSAVVGNGCDLFEGRNIISTLFEETEKDHETLSHDSPTRCRDSNPGVCKLKSGVLTCTPARSHLVKYALY